MEETITELLTGLLKQVIKDAVREAFHESAPSQPKDDTASKLAEISIRPRANAS
jgi:hypothetical protein